VKSIAKAEALLRSRIEYIISQALSGWELWEIGNRRREALCLMGFLGSHDKKAKFKSSRVSLISSEHPLTPLPVPVW